MIIEGGNEAWKRDLKSSKAKREGFMRIIRKEFIGAFESYLKRLKWAIKVMRTWLRKTHSKE